MKTLNRTVFLFLAAVLSAAAGVEPNGLFTDHAVFQQGQKIPVFGSATDGEKVAVTFAGQKVETTAAGGRWQVELSPIKAGGPYTLTIAGTDRSIELHDILVGE